MSAVCPERDLLPEYLTGRLSVEDTARVHSHLAGCDVCRRMAAELEIGLAAMAIARDEVLELEGAAAAAAAAAPPASAPVAAGRSRWRQLRPRRIAMVAAACALLIAGGVAGVALERGNAGPETLFEFPLASASAIDASGTGTLALVDGGLQIGLDLTGLPADAEFFECLWKVDGATRSAGTFTAVDGAVDVDLVVAPFEGPPTWTLDIVAYTAGEEPQVVLTAARR